MIHWVLLALWVYCPALSAGAGAAVGATASVVGVAAAEDMASTLKISALDTATAAPAAPETPPYRPPARATERTPPRAQTGHTPKDGIKTQYVRLKPLFYIQTYIMLYVFIFAM